jgi:uroporphyrinogen decarboxylase
MQISFTPEFASRLRAHLRQSGAATHNPHGGGNTYELERAIGEDMLLTSVGWANSYYANDTYSNGADSYTDEWGVGWKSCPYETRFGAGAYTEMVHHPLADANALDAYAPPDPDRDSLYEDAAGVLARYRSEYWITGVTVTTIFETAWALRGFEQLLMDFVADPSFARRILEIPYRYHLAAAQRLVRMGVDMIWIGDDVGTQNAMLLSPAVWRCMLKPYVAEFIASVKAINPRVVIAYHSDGNIEPIIPDLIEIGVDVLNPIQPASMNPARLADKYGDRLCFWGTVDEQHTLPYGTPESVRAEIQHRVETVGREGGLILGPTHHVQLDTPMENFWAMVQTISGEERPCWNH